MFLWLCHFKASRQPRGDGSGTAEISGTVWVDGALQRPAWRRNIPVLLDKDLQGLFVGELHVGVDAEVVVALRVLPAQIPAWEEHTTTTRPRKSFHHSSRNSSDGI